MYPQTFPTIDDAYGLVRHYNLHNADLGGGTAQGLVAFLFLPGEPIWTSADLALRIAAYRKKFEAEFQQGRNFDAAVIAEAADLVGALEQRAEQRRRLVKIVRNFKFGTDGGAIWSAMSSMATCAPQRRKSTYLANESLGQRAIDAACEIERLSLFYAGQLPYTPGDDTVMDMLVQADIQRLDEALETAPPWDGKDEELSYAIEAIRQLCRWRPEYLVGHQ